MKRIIKFTAIGTLALVILLLSIQLSQAQQGGQQGPPPLPNDKQIEKMVEDLSEELSLTTDQEKQVSVKYFAHFEAVEKKMKAERPSREDMEAMETDFEMEVKSLLTKDQQVLYNTFIKEQKQKRPHKQRK
jgi:nucleoid DNA-binding protein